MVVFMQMQDAALNLHVIFGREHINRVFAHMHALLGLHHRHGGIFSQNIREKTAMIGRQMLNDHKSHAGVRGKKSQKLLKCFQSPCRRADTDYTAGLFTFFNLINLHKFLPRTAPRSVGAIIQP